MFQEQFQPRLITRSSYKIVYQTKKEYEKLLEEYPQYTEVINKLGLQDFEN